jgi:hypothetical protein
MPGHRVAVGSRPAGSVSHHRLHVPHAVARTVGKALRVGASCRLQAGYAAQPSLKYLAAHGPGNGGTDRISGTGRSLFRPLARDHRRQRYAALVAACNTPLAAAHGMQRETFPCDIAAPSKNRGIRRWPCAH